MSPCSRIAVVFGPLFGGMALAAATAQSSLPTSQPVQFTHQERSRILQLSPLPPLAPDETNAVADDSRAARFGQRLFFDPGFSRNGKVSCATCHLPEQHFTDGKQLSEGLGRAVRNAPTIINAAYQRWIFWDGRADSLWAQAIHPIENPNEMGSSRTALAQRIAGNPSLRREYEAVFGPLPSAADLQRIPSQARPAAANAPDSAATLWAALSVEQQHAINRVAANFGKAIAAYERRLVARRAPFDVFVEGLRANDPAKLAAISDSAKRGLKLFVGEANCRLCHSGPLFSDGEFHNVRVAPLSDELPPDSGRHGGVAQLLADPFNASGPFSDAPEGEAARRVRHLARKPGDAGLFRTPTLRNVAVTAPYMHQGQFADLDRVLRHYNTFDGALPPDHHSTLERFLAPLQLTDAELADLRAFLETLTDVALDPALLRTPPDQ